MTFRRRHRGITVVRGAGVSGLVAALVLLAPTAAQADGIAWDTPATTIEYGEYWAASATITDTWYSCFGSGYCATAGVVTYTGTSSGSFNTWISNSSTGFDSSLGGTATGPLAVGGYQFNFTYPPPGSTTPPFALTVVAAAMSTDLRITSDPATARGAVVSIALNGRYVDEATYGGPALPEGTWNVQVTDAEGQEVFTASLPHTAGTGSSANFYWNDVPADATFAATGSFTPTTGASNFVIPSATASFTSPAPAPVPTPPAEDEEVAAPDSSLASVPVWLLILDGLIFLGSAITATVLIVRDARSRGVAESNNGQSSESQPEPEAVNVP